MAQPCLASRRQRAAPGTGIFIFHRPFPKAASSRVLSFCQSLSALHSQCLSPHSLAAGGVKGSWQKPSLGLFSEPWARHQLCLHPQLPSLEVVTVSIPRVPGHTPQNSDCHKCLTLADSDPKFSILGPPRGALLRYCWGQQWGSAGGSSAPAGKGNALPRNSRCFPLPQTPRNELLLFPTSHGDRGARRGFFLQPGAG